jgi:hypothetical protein
MNINKNKRFSTSKIKEYKKGGYLFHGSDITGLKSIKPNESGHSKKYVYATSDLAFAIIFSARRGNSLVTMVKKNEEGVACLCERVEGIFSKLYDGVKSTIYVLDKKDFSHKEGMWASEFVSDKEVPVLEEIEIPDIKESLLELEREGEFKFVEYKNRIKHFPNIDEEEVKDVHILINKYGRDKIHKTLEEWRPDLIDQIDWDETLKEPNIGISNQGAKKTF